MSGAPGLVFAFANDRAQEARFLRNLPEERRNIREALRSAVAAGRCDYVECPDATVEEVLTECQRQGARLTALHFAGHADGKTLLFELRDGSAGPAGAASIAEFLGGLRGLKLVVLNGCSTRAQVDALRANGVRAVVATSTAIRDDVATDFATFFYRAIAAGVSIRDAFKQASGRVKEKYKAEGPEGVRAVTREVGAAGAPRLEFPWFLEGDAEATGEVLIRRRWPVVTLALCGVALLLAGLGLVLYPPKFAVTVEAVTAAENTPSGVSIAPLPGAVVSLADGPVKTASATGRAQFDARARSAGVRVQGPSRGELEVPVYRAFDQPDVPHDSTVTLCWMERSELDSPVCYANDGDRVVVDVSAIGSGRAWKLVVDEGTRKRSGLSAREVLFDETSRATLTVDLAAVRRWRMSVTAATGVEGARMAWSLKLPSGATCSFDAPLSVRVEGRSRAVESLVEIRSRAPCEEACRAPGRRCNEPR